MSATGYVYDQAWAQERARLAAIKALWDPGTQVLLERIGVSPQSRCLEIGGGGGALVAWFAARAGHVLATDIAPRFLEPLAGPEVEVRRHDCTTEPLPKDAFDLIHTRLVLEHLPSRDDVLDRLVAAVRPGGWIVVEDYDWTGYGFDPAGELDRELAEGILGFMALAGYDRGYGRRLPSALEDRGLAGVVAEGASARSRPAS